jgi:hypothetical protein
MPVFSLAVVALFGLLVRPMTQFQQGGQATAGHEDDIAPLAAVTTAGPSEFNKLLVPEGDTAGSAMARRGIHGYFIDKPHTAPRSITGNSIKSI